VGVVWLFVILAIAASMIAMASKASKAKSFAAAIPWASIGVFWMVGVIALTYQPVYTVSMRLSGKTDMATQAGTIDDQMKRKHQ
jgi:hypothetical protein